MNEWISPEEQATEPEARILWAASFLVDWVIPLLHEDQLHNPSQLIELRKKFDPTTGNGTDFTLSDALVAAQRWCAYINQRFPETPIWKVPSGRQYLRAIQLLNAAINDPLQTDFWGQTTAPEE